MRTLLLILTLSASLCNAQMKFKSAKHKCKTSHKCEAQMYYDEFDKAYTFSDEVRLNSMAHDRQTVAIYKIVYNGEKRYFMSFSGTDTGCVTSKSYVSVILESGDVLELKYTGDIKCGILTISVDVNEEQVQKLLHDSLRKVRLRFDERQDDYEVTEKNSVKFIDKLKCISLIE